MAWKEDWCFCGKGRRLDGFLLLAIGCLDILKGKEDASTLRPFLMVILSNASIDTFTYSQQIASTSTFYQSAELQQNSNKSISPTIIRLCSSHLRLGTPTNLSMSIPRQTLVVPVVLFVQGCSHKSQLNVLYSTTISSSNYLQP